MTFNFFSKAGFILTAALISVSTASLQAQTPDLFLKQDPSTGNWLRVQKSPSHVVSILGPAAAPAASSMSASLFASFNPYQALPVGSWPEAVAIGDVNNDGFNDVVRIP